MHTRSLRVAWDNSLAKRNPTGTGVYATQLIRELITIPNLSLQVFDGWDPAKRKRGEYGSQGILARTARALGGLVWNHGYFPHLLHKGKFDLLHSPSFIVPLVCPCPSVVTVFDVSFLLFPEHFEQRWRTYINFMMPSMLRSVSAIICISEDAKQALLRYYKVSSSKVHVVYCGVDSERFRPYTSLNSEWARRIGLHKDYVLHVGALTSRKNIPMLLRAVSNLRTRRKFNNHQLVLAGPELSVLAGGPEVRELIQNLDLSDVVVVAGYVPDKCLPGLYSHAKVLVMPSIYEGFGLPVLESMASGVPVIASNSSSLPEVAGGAALLVPPQDELAWADAIEDVLENRSAATELARKGLVRAREFSWKRAASQTISVYKSVASI